MCVYEKEKEREGELVVRSHLLWLLNANRCNLREATRKQRLNTKQNKLEEEKKCVKTKTVSQYREREEKKTPSRKNRKGKMINLSDIYLINSVSSLNEVRNLGAVAGQ